MNRKILILSAVGLSAGLLAACGSSNNYAGGSTPPAPTTPPVTPASQTLDTAQVLVLAQKKSEVTSPFAVNGGALTLTDTSDASDSLAVNMMMM